MPGGAPGEYSQQPRSILPRKALTERCWLEGMLGKAVKKGAGREPTPLPGPGVSAAGGQVASGGGRVHPTLPSLPLPADQPPPHIGQGLCQNTSNNVEENTI